MINNAKFKIIIYLPQKNEVLKATLKLEVKGKMVINNFKIKFILGVNFMFYS